MISLNDYTSLDATAMAACVAQGDMTTAELIDAAMRAIAVTLALPAPHEGVTSVRVIRLLARFAMHCADDDGCLMPRRSPHPPS